VQAIDSGEHDVAFASLVFEDFIFTLEEYLLLNLQLNQ